MRALRVNEKLRKAPLDVGRGGIVRILLGQHRVEQCTEALRLVEALPGNGCMIAPFYLKMPRSQAKRSSRA